MKGKRIGERRKEANSLKAKNPHDPPPAIKRPAINMPMFWEAVIMVPPTRERMERKIMPPLRPYLSITQELRRMPKMAPA